MSMNGHRPENLEYVSPGTGSYEGDRNYWLREIAIQLSIMNAREDKVPYGPELSQIVDRLSYIGSKIG